MAKKWLALNVWLACGTLCLMIAAAGCAQSAGESSTAAVPGGGIASLSDPGLQKLAADVMPLFRQHEFKQRAASLRYNLYSPQNQQPGQSYPLVVFMADATTAGAEATSPLGYGALVWAARESQASNPCYVLVPGFSGAAMDDSNSPAAEADTLVELVRDLQARENIDPARIYATGQGVGGALAMYCNVAFPDVFAASFFVDSHWNARKIDQLVEHPFIFVAGASKGKPAQTMKLIEEAARKMSRSYTWSEWDAKLPLATQDALASTMLEKGQPINLVSFEDGSLPPPGGQGSEHSFDYAYRIEPLRAWLFTQKKMR